MKSFAPAILTRASWLRPSGENFSGSDHLSGAEFRGGWSRSRLPNSSSRLVEGLSSVRPANVTPSGSQPSRTRFPGWRRSASCPPLPRSSSAENLVGEWESSPEVGWILPRSRSIFQCRPPCLQRNVMDIPSRIASDRALPHALCTATAPERRRLRSSGPVNAGTTKADTNVRMARTISSSITENPWRAKKGEP